MPQNLAERGVWIRETLEHQRRRVPQYIQVVIWTVLPRILCFLECYWEWSQNRCVWGARHGPTKCYHYDDPWPVGDKWQESILWRELDRLGRKNLAMDIPANDLAKFRCALANFADVGWPYVLFNLHRETIHICPRSEPERTDLKWSRSVTWPNRPSAMRRAYSAFLIEWMDTASVIVSTSPEVPPVIRIRKLIFEGKNLLT